MSACYPHPVMNLLRTAIFETVRALGVNFPTALIVILGIGFTVLISDKFSPPETDSVTGFVLWLIKSTAWLAAVVVVFGPFLVWNIFKVVQRERSISEQLRMAAETAALVDDQMKSFLRNLLSNPHYGVAECYTFGSVVRQDPNRDVDIVIRFDSSKPRRVRTYRDRLRNIESNFQEFHGLELHVQTFLSAENEALHRFLDDAGMHERII